MNASNIAIVLFDKKAGERLFRLDLDLANERLTSLALETAKSMRLESAEILCFVGIEEHDHIRAYARLGKGPNQSQFRDGILIYPTATLFAAGERVLTKQELALEIMVFFRAP